MPARLDRRLAYAIVLAAVGVSAAVVALVAVLVLPLDGQGSRSGQEGPGVSGQDIPPDLDPNGRIQPPDSESDPNIEYPEALSDLPGPIGDLAVAPNGDLWFVGFTGDSTTNDLYRFAHDDGRLDRFVIPASHGSHLFSAIVANSRGEVIWGEGHLVLVVDAGGVYRQIELPQPENAARLAPHGGTFVVDIALDGDDKAYLARMNTAAITELDLRTGEVNEIPLDPSLGQMERIALAGDHLWMTAIFATETTSSTTAILDLTTNELNVTPMVTSALVADGQGRVYASKQRAPGVVAADAIDAAVLSGPWTFAREHDGLQWNPRYLAVDEERGRIWAAGGGSGIVSIEPATGKEEYYGLPSVAESSGVHVPIACEYDDGCPPARPSFTSVEGIVVAPNGDLYFADQTFNRIGVVHPR